ncbi:MAG: hypothetical protein DMG63_16610 [Acidobacteria bacterium]|nr:MAG: hypothetical protein DMG63_16610 [Acidobacteriota bacterium]
MIFALMVGRKRSTKGDNNDEQTDAKATEGTTDAKLVGLRPVYNDVHRYAEAFRFFDRAMRLASANADIGFRLWDTRADPKQCLLSAGFQKPKKPTFCASCPAVGNAGSSGWLAFGLRMHSSTLRRIRQIKLMATW